MNDPDLLVERLRAPAYWMSGSSDGHEGENNAPREAADTIERLTAALKPFAEAADYYDEKFSDWGEREGTYHDNIVAGPAGIKVSHYRKARTALGGQSNG